MKNEIEEVEKVGGKMKNNAYFTHYLLKQEKQTEFFKKCIKFIDQDIWVIVDQLYFKYIDSLPFPQKANSSFDYESFTLAIYCHLHKRKFNKEFVVKNTEIKNTEIKNMDTPNYFALVNATGVYVKEAYLFIKQGGKIMPWGQSWELIHADDLDSARQLAIKIRRKRFPDSHVTTEEEL